MKALSVRQPWAELIARGEKVVEYRTWLTHYRGDLLIVSSKQRASGEEDIGAPCGVAVCIVTVASVDGYAGAYEWHLVNPRRVAPEPVKGQVGLFNVAFEPRILDASELPSYEPPRAHARAAPRVVGSKVVQVRPTRLLCSHHAPHSARQNRCALCSA